MVSNFEEVITGLRQCQEKLFSDNGVMGCLVSIEAEVEDVKTILSAIDDPHAYEIIFLLSRVLELIHIIYDQDLQSYDKRAREIENKIQGRAYSSSSFNISDEVKTDVFVTRGSAGGVRESEVQLKPVEEPKVENLTPAGREAVRVLRDDRSLQPIHSEVDKPAQQIMYPDDLKSLVDTELPQASRIGSASEIDGTPVRYHNEFRKFRDAKRDYYQGLKNGGVEGPRPEFSPWKAEKTEADYNTAFEGLSEVEKTKHSIISIDKFKGVIPHEIKESVKSIWETGRLPKDKLWKKAQGPKEYGNMPENKSGGHILPEKDVNGNPITYTEYDVKPPEPIVKENGKLGLDRGKHRIVVGSNGSIYYSPDHYLTFIRLID